MVKKQPSLQLLSPVIEGNPANTFFTATYTAGIACSR
jgi:hypothetical protein